MQFQFDEQRADATSIGRISIHPVMENRHPIDQDFRAKLRAAMTNQTQIEFARQIGWSQNRLSKYISGKGKATIDDIARMTAQLSAGPASVVDKREPELLRLFRQIEDDDKKDDVIADIRLALRRQRRAAKKAQTPRQDESKRT